jgi:hypothetical protein
MKQRKLVDHPKDWPWNSWAFYAKGEAGWCPSIRSDNEKREITRVKSPTRNTDEGHPRSELSHS